MLLTFAGIVPVHAATSCHMIAAKGVGQDDGTGDHGQGNRRGSCKGLWKGVVTPTSPPADGVVTFTEVVKFTTENGTLTVEVAGAINILTGRFSASGSVKDAAGKLARRYRRHRTLRFSRFHDRSFYREHPGRDLPGSGAVAGVTVPRWGSSVEIWATAHPEPCR